MSLRDAMLELADDMKKDLLDHASGELPDLRVQISYYEKLIRKLCKAFDNSEASDDSRPTTLRGGLQGIQTLQGNATGDQTRTPKKLKITKMPVHEDPWPGGPPQGKPQLEDEE